MSESEARAFIDQLTYEERLTLYQLLKAIIQNESAVPQLEASVQRM